MAVAILFAALVSQPAPIPAPPASFRAQPQPAGRAPLIPLDATPLADARALLGRGRPADALARVESARRGALGDRASLVAGDALLALAEAEPALLAYADAVARAQTTGVRRAGARGVIASLALLDRPEARLRWVKGLRAIERDSVDLRLAHAEALADRGRFAEADALLRGLLADAPRSSLSEPARRVRAGLPPAHRAPFTPDELRRRFRAELDAGATDAARATLKTLAPPEPERTRLTWELLRAARDRDGEIALLDAALADDPNGPDRAEMGLRRGRIELSRDRTDAAVARFDEVVKRFPESRWAVEAAFLAGWARYDEGRYEDAERRMRLFVDAFARSRKVTEAWWYAGWTAYLDGRDAAAQSAWASLVRDHPDSDLVPAAHYWTGRSLARTGQDDAVRAYRNAVEAAPLAYYAFWARRRLRAARAEVEPLRPPGRLEPFEIRQLLVELGPGRPISVDRAVALHAAGLGDAVDDEVRALLGAWSKASSLRQVVLRTDLLHRLGAHARAFRYAHDHRPDATKLAEGDYWAWRAYRHVFPEAFGESVRAAGRDHDVDPRLVWSVMKTESHYRADALSPAGARGLMQVLPRTARRIGRQVPAARPHAARLLEPDSNVWLGAWYLEQLGERYRGYRPALIGAYNAGPPAMKRWLEELDGRPTDEFIERISYRETRRYVRRVLETQWTYELMYGRDPSPVAETARNLKTPSGAVAF